ncbi:hypothetical protein RUK43_001958 [Vibrio cholerae]|nr:hypothetical protein [Vibrio cholerae]
MSQNEIKLPTGSDRNKIEALAEQIQQASSVVNQLQIEIEALGQSQGNGELTPCYRFTEESDYFRFSGDMTGEQGWQLRTRSFVELTFMAPKPDEPMHQNETALLSSDGFILYVIGESGTSLNSDTFAQNGLSNPVAGMLWVDRRARKGGLDGAIQDHQVSLFLDGVEFDKSVMVPRDGKKHTIRANFIGVPKLYGETFDTNFSALEYIQLYKGAALVSFLATTDSGLLDIKFNHPAKDHYSAIKVAGTGIEAKMKRAGFLNNFSPEKFVKL